LTYTSIPTTIQDQQVLIQWLTEQETRVFSAGGYVIGYAIAQSDDPKTLTDGGADDFQNTRREVVIEFMDWLNSPRGEIVIQVDALRARDRKNSGFVSFDEAVNFVGTPA
jgi:hypothetical protein